MAFKNRDMSVIAYANGFTLWHYKTSEDAMQAIIGNNKYFGKIYTLCNIGDLIIVNCPDTTAMLVIENIGDNTVCVRRM